MTAVDRDLYLSKWHLAYTHMTFLKCHALLYPSELTTQIRPATKKSLGVLNYMECSASVVDNQRTKRHTFRNSNIYCDFIIKIPFSPCQFQVY